MLDELILTKLTQQEFKGLYQIMRPIWLDTYSFLPTEQVELLLDKYFSPEAINYYLSKGYEYFSVGGNGLLVIVENEDSVYIDKLYIYPENRGQGIASRVFNKLITERKKALTLNVNRNNSVAVSCYLKNGFTVVKEEIIPLGKGLVNCDYVMKKEV